MSFSKGDLDGIPQMLLWVSEQSGVSLTYSLFPTLQYPDPSAFELQVSLESGRPCTQTDPVLCQPPCDTAWSCRGACSSPQRSRLSKELQFCSSHQLLSWLKISRELQKSSALKISQLWQKNLSGPHLSKLYLLPSTHWPSPTWGHRTFALFIAINFFPCFLVCMKFLYGLQSRTVKKYCVLSSNLEQEAKSMFIFFKAFNSV